jgi:peptide/nickel transport system substrate-binding protein
MPHDPFLASNHGLSNRGSARSLAVIVSALVVCLATVWVSGCGSGAPGPAAGEPRERTITIAAGALPSAINEYIAQARAMDTALAYFMLYMPLVTENTDFQDGPATFGPRLADTWEFSDDHRTLTFHLRTDAKWSDGVPITAEDIRFTWQAQTSPEIAWSGLEIKRPIIDVEVVDAKTARFHYAEPYANQLVDAAQGVILPKHVWGELPFAEWRANGAWFRERAVSSGPFVLERWEDGERLVLRRNEHYFAEQMPAYDVLVIRAVPDEATRIAQLRAGEANFCIVEPAGATMVKGVPGLELLAYDYRQIGFVTWNQRRAIFQDARVRQALTFGIDREAIVNTLNFGYSRLTTSPYLLGAWVYNESLERRPYDPDRARALLAEAGWHDSDGDGVVDRDGIPMGFTIETNSESRLRQDITVMIQEQLGRIGIDVEVATADFGSLIERERAGDFDASVLGIGIDTSWNLDVLFHSRSIGAHAWNLGAYRNDEVDRLIDEIQTVREPADAKPLHDALQEILWREQPMTILYQNQKLVATRGITNVEPSIISAWANVAAWRLIED